MAETKIEHEEESRTETTRYVQVSEVDVRFQHNTARASCGFRISSYRNESDREPELRLEGSPTHAMSRAQWEQMKRLGDLAFAEYAKKWPAPEGGYR